MHAGRVERVVAIGDPQESRTLLKCLGPQSRNLEQCRSTAESARGIPMSDDGLGECRCHTRHPGQQRHRRGVEVDADGVHRVLDHCVEAACESARRDVMLILTDTDRLRVDLHQFCERVLKAARDRHRATDRDVEVG